MQFKRCWLGVSIAIIVTVFATPTRALASDVVVTSDCAFGGKKVRLSAGRYTLTDLVARGVVDNDISGVEVPLGFTVQLFDGPNFTGKSLTLTQSDGCIIKAGFNDLTSSIIISQAGTARSTPPPPVQTNNGSRAPGYTHRVDNVAARVMALNANPTPSVLSDTYSTEHLFGWYAAGIDHVGGIAWLPDNRFVLVHSTRAGRDKVIVVKQTSASETQFYRIGRGNHPGAIQAAGDFVVVPIYGGSIAKGKSELSFFDAAATDPVAAELVHLRTAHSGEANAAAILFHPTIQQYFVVVTNSASYGSPTTLTVYKSTCSNLRDSRCTFAYKSNFQGFGSQGAMQLVYDGADAAAYLISMFRTEKDGEDEWGVESVVVSKIDDIDAENPSASERPVRRLSDSGDKNDYGAGFRWGGSVAGRGDEFRLVAVSRTLTYGPAEPFAKLHSWSRGKNTGENCAANGECNNGACARASADEGVRPKCCAVNKTHTYAGYDYCGSMPDGATCWSDVMCKANYCRGNAGGTRKGTCGKLSVGASCSSNGDCANGACGRASAKDGTGATCCASGQTRTYGGFDYCGSMPKGTRCWSDAMCASGNCKGNMSGMQRGNCK